jgi:hypothetical protein
MKALLLMLLISSHAFAWTLTSARRGFENSDITIEFASNTCLNTGFSMSKLKSYTKEAVEDYWNDVPTSALNLKVGGTKNVDVSADSGSVLLNTKVTKNKILIGCNSSGITQFSTTSILAGASLGCAGNDCYAYVMMNDFPGTQLANQSSSEIVATVAHELGHALGLGHTQESFNLMYYSTGTKKQTFLGQDDIDGITWLYPHSEEMGGLLGSCGTITTESDRPWKFLLIFMGAILMIITFHE